jgi:hypothetical protein
MTYEITGLLAIGLKKIGGFAFRLAVACGERQREPYRGERK